MIEAPKSRGWGGGGVQGVGNVDVKMSTSSEVHPVCCSSACCTHLDTVSGLSKLAAIDS